MNLVNALLNSIIAPGIPSPSGAPSAGTETAINVRCLLDDVRNAQRLSLGAKISDATSCLYVRHIVTDVAQLKIGRDVVVTLDLPAGAAKPGPSPTRYRILHRDERVSPTDANLSHVICFLKPVPEG